MELSQLTITPMLQKHRWEISEWKYEGIYSFYNHVRVCEHIGDPECPIANSYVVYDDKNIFVGYFLFGIDGRIPTVENYEYSPEYLDIGLGLRPDFCGKGSGVAFVKLGIEFARKKYKIDRFRLSVAAFNERAIKVYEKVGFNKVCEVTNFYLGNRFYIMEKE